MIKSILKEILCLFPVNFRVKLKFFIRNRYMPDFSNPQTFNEKITNRKIFDSNSLYPICADKFLARDYVKSKVGEEFLIPLFYHNTSLSPDIVRDIFEKNGPCVFKVNHNSGGIFFVKSSDDESFSKLCQRITRQLGLKYGKYHDEMWYDRIKPVILAEKLILNENGTFPEDYKFHIFKGDFGPKVVIQVDYDRFSGHNRTFYNTDGDTLHYINKYPNNFKPFEGKEKIQLMLPIALKLAEDFDYVRVDLYFVQDKIYFGELTFSHGSGLDNFKTYQQDLEWGSFWEQFRKHG